MTYIAKPDHHPTLAPNKRRLHARDYEAAISTLCAGCGHDSISAAIIQACWELDIAAAPRRQALGIGCSSKTPDYFSRRQPRLQHRARPHALGADRRQPRQPRLLYLGVSGDGDFGVDRPRPVRARHAPRREHGLHRREQRRLRPDQGPVLGDRRPGKSKKGDQRRQPGGPDRDGAAARRDLRRARLLRRQGAARAADQGAMRAPAARPSSTSSAPA